MFDGMWIILGGAICLSPLFGFIFLLVKADEAGSASYLCETWGVTSIMGKSCVYFYWYSIQEPLTILFKFFFNYPNLWYSNLTLFPNLNIVIYWVGVFFHIAIFIAILSLGGLLIDRTASWVTCSLLILLIYIAIIASIQFILLALLAISSIISWLFAT